jgi:hypothetical protein
MQPADAERGGGGREEADAERIEEVGERAGTEQYCHRGFPAPTGWSRQSFSSHIRGD